MFDFVSFQKTKVLLPKRYFCVVLFLILNVPNNSRKLRMARFARWDISRRSEKPWAWLKLIVACFVCWLAVLLMLVVIVKTVYAR